eukprot:TRINITY_DN66492_c0_g1_i1.p1 TRINITY_DN66492_c0_g1~~TRINITY_DN66492_c0_g1_i1.p1  ORF type:complete len:654 (+),score=128.69 TRINITY_DN66492_c0_g1_i1:285-1964(+)
MPELIDAIGSTHAARLAKQAAASESAIRSALPEDIAEEVHDLVYDTVLLPLHCPLVSEAIASALAVLAGLTEPGLLPEGRALLPGDVLEVLEGVALRVDAFQPYLFSVLCRADAVRNCACKDSCSQRTLVALSGACAWLLAGLCRAMGYGQLNADVLWTWAEGDALWVTVLAKGILSLDDLISQVPETPLNGALCPSDLDQLQAVVAEAVLKLVGADLAFAENLPLPVAATDEVAEPAVVFAKHWAKLAVAVAESDLMGPLLKVASASSSHRMAFQLAAFLARILQPELQSSDPDWSVRHSSAPLIVEAARGAASAVRQSLAEHGSRLWPLFRSGLRSGRAPKSFWRDCCDVALNTAIPAAEVTAFISDALAKRVDEKTLAACCVFAANAGMGAGSEDGGLSSALQALPAEERTLVAGHLAQWSGPVHPSLQASWLQYLQGPAQMSSADDSSCRPGTWPLKSCHRQALGMSGLKDLLAGAPADLKCCLDNQLVTNPVRSPYGHVFEYTSLASTLALNGFVCPMTGQALALESCSHDWDLKTKADSHINAWMHRVKWAKR